MTGSDWALTRINLVAGNIFMIEQSNKQNVQVVVEAVYEAPAIESVLTSDELEREVFYAGANVPSREKSKCSNPTVSPYCK
jgi:hypothetical protein